MLAPCRGRADRRHAPQANNAFGVDQSRRTRAAKVLRNFATFGATTIAQ